MPLQGTFDVLDFSGVLRLLARLQVTGRLHVRSRSYGANLFLDEGQLVGADQSEHQPAAAAGDVRGRLEEVCFEMLEADRGTFEFSPGRASVLPVQTRLEVDTVLTRARKRLTEWHELQEVITSLETQPHLVVELDGGEVTIDRERWRMLTAIDGRRNLRAIGRALALSDFDVCRITRDLLDAGVVELDGRAALAAAAAESAPVIPTPQLEPTGDSVRITTERAAPATVPSVAGDPLDDDLMGDDTVDDDTVGADGLGAERLGADTVRYEAGRGGSGAEVAPSPVPDRTDQEAVDLGPGGPDAPGPVPMDGDMAADGSGGRRGRRVVRIRSRPAQDQPGRKG